MAKEVGSPGEPWFRCASAAIRWLTSKDRFDSRLAMALQRAQESDLSKAWARWRAMIDGVDETGIRGRFDSSRGTRDTPLGLFRRLRRS